MDVAALLLELYGRIPPLVKQAVEGLDADQLTPAPAPGGLSPSTSARCTEVASRP
jgi:hypothetical protein